MYTDDGKLVPVISSEEDCGKLKTAIKRPTICTNNRLIFVLETNIVKIFRMKITT